ncbi:MAG: AAA family ATPase [Nitrosomonadales bacterium]|nr:AAA family ATPase [Nitrosomonadales bacterium]
MRSDCGADQAEGLRRLLICNRTQVITVVAGKVGVGRTSATINLAAALAHSGKNVLVLDENHAPNNLSDRLGLFAKHDLLDVARGRCKLHEAVLTGRGFCVLPTARAINAVQRAEAPGMPMRVQPRSGDLFAGGGSEAEGNPATLKREEQQRLKKALTEASDGVDVMLVDTAALAGQATVSSSLVSGAALLLVVEATPSGITESYALIKRLATENVRQRFEIMVNKANNEKAAMTVFENMAKVARRNLPAHLEYLGYIPSDDRVNYAAHLGKSVIEAFPAAASAKSYVKLSQKLSRLPMQHDEAEGGVSAIIQNLMKQMPQPATLAQCYEASGAG